jgi:hypothetical protein
MTSPTNWIGPRACQPSVEMTVGRRTRLREFLQVGTVIEVNHCLSSLSGTCSDFNDFGMFGAYQNCARKLSGSAMSRDPGRPRLSGTPGNFCERRKTKTARKQFLRLL